MIKILFRPGFFIATGETVCVVYAAKAINDQVDTICLTAIQVGDRRSVVQDMEFGFEQLTEIALRALSPGINNPDTAFHCLDRIKQAIMVLKDRSLLSHVVADDEGQARMLRDCADYGDVVRVTIKRIRQFSKNNIIVTKRLLTVIETLLQQSLPRQLREALLIEVENVELDVADSTLNKHDKAEINTYYNELMAISAL